MTRSRGCVLTGVAVAATHATPPTCLTARLQGASCVAATEALPLGTVVIQERPYATALPPCPQPTACRACFTSLSASTKGRRQCRWCGAAHYCSYKCASADRRPHRDSGECWLYSHAAGLALAAPDSLMREAVLALRHMAAPPAAELPQPPIATDAAVGTSGAAAEPEPQAAGGARSKGPIAGNSSNSNSNSSASQRQLREQLDLQLASWQRQALGAAMVQEADEEVHTEGSGGGDGAAARAEAAFDGRLGLGLLAALLAQAARAGRAARQAHLRAEERREQRRRAREERRGARKEHKQQQQAKQQQQQQALHGGQGQAAGAARAPAGGSTTSSSSSSASSSSDDLSSSSGDEPSMGQQQQQHDGGHGGAPQRAFRSGAGAAADGLAALATRMGAAACSASMQGAQLERAEQEGETGARWREDVAAAAQAVVHARAAALQVSAQPACASGLLGTGRATSLPAPFSLPLALYRVGGALRHSCSPCAAFHFRPGGHLLVRTTRDLPPGARVSVSLLDDLAAPRARRQQLLRERSGARCACARCARGGPPGGGAAGAEDARGPGGGEGEGAVAALQRLVEEGAELLLARNAPAEAHNTLARGLDAHARSGAAAKGSSAPGGAAASGSAALEEERACRSTVLSLLASAARLCARGGCNDGDGGGGDAAGGSEARMRWWAAAATASVAAAAEAEQMLAADPGLLQHAAAAWGDAASTLTELLSALLQPSSSSSSCAADAESAVRASLQAAERDLYALRQRGEQPAPGATPGSADGRPAKRARAEPTAPVRAGVARTFAAPPPAVAVCSDMFDACAALIGRQPAGDSGPVASSSAADAVGAWRAASGGGNGGHASTRGERAGAEEARSSAAAAAVVARAAALALAHALARAQLLLRMLLGEAHSACEACAFMPFFGGLPYEVASGMVALASALLSAVHAPWVPL